VRDLRLELDPMRLAAVGAVHVAVRHPFDVGAALDALDSVTGTVDGEEGIVTWTTLLIAAVQAYFGSTSRGPPPGLDAYYNR
jgi:hypothetical protein